MACGLPHTTQTRPPGAEAAEHAPEREAAGEPRDAAVFRGGGVGGGGLLAIMAGDPVGEHGVGGGAAGHRSQQPGADRP